MFAKITALLLAIAVAAALWYRSEAISHEAEAQAAEVRSASLLSALNASKKAAQTTEQTLLARLAVANKRKSEATHAQALDRAAVQAAPDWASQPIPAGVLERLR